ncbi:MAG: NFACT family protein [Clostridia bacterium]|nr:NFACT family protein [Clostridia bacterium]
MAFDAGMLRAIVHEISETLCGGAKVEKISQPSRDEFVLHLHAGGVTRRLVFVVGTNVPHFSYSRIERENLPTPSMYCMLLRKHLVGAKLVEAAQIDFERAARFVFAARDELGFGVTRTLVAEMMGKYSNLILLDGEDRIISAFRIVDFSASRVRQVLPGMHYVKPPVQEKLDPLTADREAFFAAYAAYPPERPAARFLSDTYHGIAAITAREIARRAGAAADAPLASVTADGLFAAHEAWFSDVRECRFTPTLVSDSDGTPVEYSYAPIGGGGLTVTPVASFGELLDSYFGERDRRERLRQRSSDLARFLSRREAQLVRKLEAQREELSACEQGEEYKRSGDLITENIYRIARGMTSLRALDYRVDPPAEVTVALDARLSPAANAQRMYKLYTKSRRAKEKLTELIASGEEELAYLGSVRGFLDRAESEQDFTELRAELASVGYLSRERDQKNKKAPKARPMELTTAHGYRLLVGRNNLQNDMLTFRIAAKDDLWFHAKGYGGSHVILVAGGEEPPAEDYTEAAEIAAYYSQAGDSVIPVDYTRVKNIKKPPASRPGYVTYKTNSTAYVHPKKPQGVK